MEWIQVLENGRKVLLHNKTLRKNALTKTLD